MLAYHKYFSHLDGDTAYLAGVIPQCALHHLSDILPRYWALEADVFKTDISGINDAINKRIGEYLTVNNPKKFDAPDKLELQLNRVSGDLHSVVSDLFDRYKASHVDDEKKRLETFTKALKFLLGGEIKGIYVADDNMDDRTRDAFGWFYTYIIFELVFIEYEDYVVMLVFGSDE